MKPTDEEIKVFAEQYANGVYTKDSHEWNLMVGTLCMGAKWMREQMGDNWISVEDRLPEKDIPYIVFGVNKYGKGRTMKAKWIPKFYEEDDAEQFSGECDYNEEADMYYWPEGWYEWNECEEIHWKIPFSISHYQPLPTPSTNPKT